MKEPLMIFTGITYNYYERKTNFALAGFLDEETNMFTGIEVKDKKIDFSSIEQIKQKLRDAKVVCGIKGDMFQYCTIDTRKWEFQFSSLEQSEGDQNFYGYERILYSKNRLPLQEISLKCCDFGNYIYDEELSAFVSVTLANQETNANFRMIRSEVESHAISKQVQAKRYSNHHANISNR